MQDTLHVRVDTRQGQVSGEPCLPQALRHLWQTGEDLKTSQHLAIRDDCTQCSAKCPQRRRACRKDTLKDPAEDASRRSLRPS